MAGGGAEIHLLPPYRARSLFVRSPLHHNPHLALTAAQIHRLGKVNRGIGSDTERRNLNLVSLAHVKEKYDLWLSPPHQPLIWQARTGRRATCPRDLVANGRPPGSRPEGETMSLYGRRV